MSGPSGADLVLTGARTPLGRDPRFREFVDHVDQVVLDRRAGVQLSACREATFDPVTDPWTTARFRSFWGADARTGRREGGKIMSASMTYGLARLPTLWVDTALASVRMTLDAQVVLAARLPMILDLLIVPLRADHRELRTMVTEKMDAAARSGRMVRKAAGAVRSTTSANAAAARRAASGGLPTIDRWFEIAARNVELWSSLMALPAEIVRPIQLRVADNARRLGPKVIG